VGACLHPDFDSIQPMYPSRNFRGADQVRRNWQAIFDAEPGFRLTVLRSASTDDTVWLELHGAGRDAEVAGIFIMGIVGDRIRWARIYSALVEPVAAGVGEASDPAAGLPEVDAHAGGGDAIAPVLDMERSGRRRRRRRGAAEGTVEGTSEMPETVSEIPEALPADDDTVEPAAAQTEIAAAAETDLTGASESEAEPVTAVDDVEVIDVLDVAEVKEDELVVVVEPEPASGAPADGGLDTEAVPVVVWDDPPPQAQAQAVEPAAEVELEPEAEAEVVAVAVVSDPETEADPVPTAGGERPAEDADGPEPPKWRFGKRARP
ncbi:MAG TPA: nuclear transport factor 2 family protein, partial [Acidimicrobiales bacterium]|nr:nuclear transport factor 2 family protein [Acidimicrobiales bacterium]